MNDHEFNELNELAGAGKKSLAISFFASEATKVERVKFE